MVLNLWAGSETLGGLVKPKVFGPQPLSSLLSRPWIKFPRGPDAAGLGAPHWEGTLTNTVTSWPGIRWPSLIKGPCGEMDARALPVQVTHGRMRFVLTNCSMFSSLLPSLLFSFFHLFLFFLRAHLKKFYCLLNSI